MGAGVAALLLGIAGTVKALRGKSNGHADISKQEWHRIKDQVGTHGYSIDLIKFQIAGMQTTLDRHTTTLEDIRGDLSKIMAAVDRRDN